jgi:hypothetical protein
LEVDRFDGPEKANLIILHILLFSLDRGLSI